MWYVTRFLTSLSTSNKLGVDCVFHEDLTEALSKTLQFYANPSSLILVVSPLRASHVQDAFLGHWVGSEFEISRLDRAYFCDDELGKGAYVVWFAKRRTS